MIKIIDDFLPDPSLYRNSALTQDFRSFHFEAEKCTFHGIALIALSDVVPTMIEALYPQCDPTLSFLRKSPHGQVEPHFIHTDIDMGKWSSILYLNPDPPDGDGTTFWTHESSHAIESLIPHERSAEGQSTKGWTARQHVQARFNRLLIWPSTYFHSRSIFENWGEGDLARLTHVTFGKGITV